MTSLVQDLRRALRGIVRNPGFNALIVGTLGVGIGAAVAVFSVYDAAVPRALPFRDPDRLVMLWGNATARAAARERVSWPDYVDWREQSETIDEMAAFHYRRATLRGHGEPSFEPGCGVTPNFFSVLGVSPLLGRTFAPAGADPTDEHAMILGYGLWQRRFGGDPGVVGTSIDVNGNPTTIIGVMPKRFSPPDCMGFWMPRQRDDYMESHRNTRWLWLVGRLSPGARVDQAREELGLIGRRLAEEHPADNAGYEAMVTPIREHLLGSIETTLLLMLAVSGLVVLIACANVANLLLSRGTEHAYELAVRSTLGASRWRLARQLLTETLILALLGGAAGLLVGFWILRALIAANPDGVAGLAFGRIDGGAALFTLAVCLLTTLVCGAAPVPRLAGLRLTAALQGGRDSNRRGRPGRRLLQRGLVVLQIALSVVLLVSTALLGRSLHRVEQVDLGFDPARVLTIRAFLPLDTYTDSWAWSPFYSEILARLSDLPAVEEAAVTNWDEPTGEPSLLPFQADTGFPAAEAGRPMMTTDTVTPNFFRALGVPLVKGRAFDQTDRRGGPEVAIINQALADEIAPGGDAVGVEIFYWDRLYGETPPPQVVTRRTVVGVVGNMRRYGRDQPPLPELFLPFAQSRRRSMRLVLRTKGDPAAVADLARQVIHEMDPGLPLVDVAPLEDLLAPALAPRRFHATVFGLSAVIGVLLAVAGLFALVSYLVSRRTYEIGLRMAVGAGKPQVVRLFLKEGLMIAAVGSVVGLGLAWALSRIMRNLLFEVTPADPVAYLLATVVVVIVAAAASYFPAQRAAGVEPMKVLRNE